MHTNRLVSLLEESGIVHHQHPAGLAQMLHNVVPEIISNQVGVPDVGGKQALHPVGSGIARLLRQLPAVLALYPAEQPLQILQGPPTRLTTPEPSRDAPMHPLDAFGPSGHFISPNNHRLTSPLIDCPNSTVS
jgi:hypothetical protein